MSEENNLENQGFEQEKFEQNHNGHKSINREHLTSYRIR